MSIGVSEQTILDSLRHVPVERWGEVLRFLNALGAAGPPIRTGTDLARSELVGSWSDRNDLGNSGDFARHLRRQAEARREAADAAGH